MKNHLCKCFSRIRITLSLSLLSPLVYYIVFVCIYIIYVCIIHIYIYTQWNETRVACTPNLWPWLNFYGVIFNLLCSAPRSPHYPHGRNFRTPTLGFYIRIYKRREPNACIPPPPPPPPPPDKPLFLFVFCRITDTQIPIKYCRMLVM